MPRRHPKPAPIDLRKLTTQELEELAARQRAYVESLSIDELYDLKLRAGYIVEACELVGDPILDSLQRAAYDKYRAWEAAPLSPHGFAKVFGIAWARQLGKTTLTFVIAAENSLRRPGSFSRFCTSAQKDTAGITDLVAPRILDRLPEDCRPVYQGSKEAQPAGFYSPNESKLILVGLDQRKNAQRGRPSDSDYVTESAWVRNLHYVVTSVFLRSFQTKPHSRLLLESSAPEEQDTDWENKFVPDFIARDAWHTANIYDSPRFSKEWIEREIENSGGINSPQVQRELLNISAINREDRVIPEFNSAVHVKTFKVPEYAHCYVGFDPGYTHLSALVWGFFDPARKVFCVQHCWAQRQPLPSDIAKVVQETNHRLWGLSPKPEERKPLQYWDGARLLENPYMQFADNNNPQHIADLGITHGVYFTPTDKRDSLEVRVGQMNDWFRDLRIEIAPWVPTTTDSGWRPDTRQLVSQLSAAKWDKARKSFAVTSQGHSDLVAALMYCLRGVHRGADPMPPAYELARIKDPTATLWRSPQTGKGLSPLEQLIGRSIR